MSQTTVPRTPTPERIPTNEVTPVSSPSKATTAQQADGNDQPSAAMTPPPSSQPENGHHRNGASKAVSRAGRTLASPPPTLRSRPPVSMGTLYGEIPNAEAVEKMSESELRRLVAELLPALGEARVGMAHSKLQHSLLAIEKEESMKRAEVEHEATKREVQVLQGGSPAAQAHFSPLGSPQATAQRNLHMALEHCRELQHENSILEKHLRSSKKFIARLDAQNADLKDHVQLLRQRIKENRDHLNDLQESGAMSLHSTPHHTYSTPHITRTPRTPASARPVMGYGDRPIVSQDPFDALLQASHVLNGETSSVPSSPEQRRPRKSHHQHMRGAHSLSSLPTTPERRPVTADATLTTPIHLQAPPPQVPFSAPGTQIRYETEERSRSRADRESTISASEDEGMAEDDDADGDLPSSQASQLATTMLRRSLEEQQMSPSKAVAPRLSQARLFGRVTKSGGGGNGKKRNISPDSYDAPKRGGKALKMGNGQASKIGLGIKS